MFLSVCPQTLDHAAGRLVVLSQTLPAAAAVRAQLDTVGACLPGLAVGEGWGRGEATGPVGTGWACALDGLTAALLAHAADLGRCAQAYRGVDAGLR